MRQSAGSNSFAFDIEIADGRLLDIVDLAEEAITAAPEQHVFQRGGMLVRLKRIDRQEFARGLNRPAGALIIAEATPEYLRCEMARTARYLKYDGRSKKHVPIDPPLRYATALSVKDEWTFRPLLATIETPTLRRDGSILQVLGYDELSGLYFDSTICFPEIISNPSRADAQVALHTLGKMLGDFPFVAGAESVALAAILTSVVRRALPTAPMFLFDAPTRGSGKTLLSRVVSMIATGREPMLMTYTSAADEDRKRIVSALAAADPVVLLDNISQPLQGDALCAVLSAPEFSDRLLGTNNMVRVPTCATFLATGNNIVARGDMSTRVLVCRIDPSMEHPEEREFNYDLLVDVAERRPELVAAALTIMRAYVVAGCPPQQIKPFGRFEAWSNMVRAPLVWLGCADPCASRQQAEDDDPEFEALATLLTTLHNRFDNRTFTVAELVKTVIRDQDQESMLDSTAALKDALAAISAHGEINARSIGKAFARHKDRVVGGLKLFKRGNRQHATLWQVSEFGEV
jgi:hypothetical protein